MKLSFFGDACFIEAAIRLLEVFDPDHVIRHLVDYFPKDTEDTVWMPQVARFDPVPVVLSGDGGILRNKVECAVLKSCNLTYVLMADGWLNTNWNEYAWKLLKAWPTVVAEVRRIRQPTIFRLSIKSLKMERLHLTSEILI